MNITIPGALLSAAIFLFVTGVVAGAEELIVGAIVCAAASAGTYIVALRDRLGQAGHSSEIEMRFREIEARLGLTEAELDAASAQPQRLRAERDFDRELRAGREILATRAIGLPQ